MNDSPAAHDMRAYRFRYGNMTALHGSLGYEM